MGTRNVIWTPAVREKLIGFRSLNWIPKYSIYTVLQWTLFLKTHQHPMCCHIHSTHVESVSKSHCMRINLEPKPFFGEKALFLRRAWRFTRR